MSLAQKETLICLGSTGEKMVGYMYAQNILLLKNILYTELILDDSVNGLPSSSSDGFLANIFYKYATKT